MADCVSSAATLSKYGVTFVYDIAAYLDTLTKVEMLRADIFVPSHADPSHDVRELSEINRKQVLDVEQKIRSICKTPQTTDGIITEVFRTFGLTIEQYVLVGSTVRSYLSWMKDRGVIDYSVDNSMLLWKTVE